ncbi:MAG: hypothetical protein K0R89_975 [Ramlibacter sp.]|jgi:hypothetical protein|nr:hypothetical protein [Ramlibacter sp.]
MLRFLATFLSVALLAGGALARGGGAPIIIFIPGGGPLPPEGNTCIPEGVGSGKETESWNGIRVLARGIHGIDTKRCPDPAFPVLATATGLATQEVRSAPSSQCVPYGSAAGDEVAIDQYGVAKILSVMSVTSKCQVGAEAMVISLEAHRAATPAASPETASTRGSREPTDAEMQKEYERLVASAAPVKEYRVRHILVRTKEEAVAAIEEIRGGKDFAEVAARVSLDPGSRINGGDLGWNTASSFDPDFSKAMVRLDPEGLSQQPTKTPFGWHVIELLASKIGKDSFPPLASVKQRIAERLKSAQASELRVPAKAVCRQMVTPDVSAAASGGIKGTVVAEMRVENGKVAEVVSLTGPSALHPMVTEALLKYGCDRLDRPVLATQSFEF